MADEKTVPQTSSAVPDVPEVARLRNATVADLDVLVEVEEIANTAALPHIFPPELYPFPRQQVRDRWAAELADPTFRIRIAEVSQPVDAEDAPDIDGTRPRRHVVAGYCACREDGDHVWLEHIAVLPQMQGSGLSVMLIAEARSTYRGREMHLWVLEQNARARRFYEREGWAATGVTKPAPYVPNPPLVEYTVPS
ncbi:hypothetical protein KEM60_03193 [Austwickia sp. TVS 96-490-7B]|uniref:GNAT family N-acetyltransferase n=1 Tax=Austwickia sp. TVS 96-490-7B TaxID=2830843 RepID=UPI001C56CB3E|nr:GNAT family N-acetyltransferase [Austwickia sp. TVS 96-490-7B]MBW3086964.1 hypothetical protein [Austwickia sp. TVS 96-490-7B]